MKNVKWSSLFIAVCYILAGLLFFLDAGLTRELICTWIGYALLAVGIVSVISYFIKDKKTSFLRNDLRDGLILITIGILPLIRKDIFIELVYSLLAVVIMISGYNKLQDCVNAWRMGLKLGILYFILSAISITIGLIVMLDTTIDIKPLHNLIGAGLMYSGITDLISTIFLSRKMSQYIKSEEIIEKYEKETPEDEQEESLNNNNAEA